MKPSADELAAVVKKLICARFFIRPEEVEPDESLEDLGADELDMIELTEDFEKEFGIALSDDEMFGLRTIADAVTYVGTKVVGQADTKRALRRMRRSRANSVPQRRGAHLEKKVYRCLGRLVSAGLAERLRQHEAVEDRDGITRKTDLTVTLVTNLVRIRVTIECKARSKKITLDDVDQIRTLKASLPERNIYWLVYEGALSDSAARALKRNGISSYSLEELNAVVEKAVAALDASKSQIGATIKDITRLSMMHTGLQAMAENKLHALLSHCLEALAEAGPLLAAVGSPDLHGEIEKRLR